MSAPALKALAAASAAGVTVIPDGDGLILDPMPAAVPRRRAQGGEARSPARPGWTLGGARDHQHRRAAARLFRAALGRGETRPQALPRRGLGRSSRRCSAGRSKSFTPSRRSGPASTFAAPLCSSPIVALWRSPRRRLRPWASRDRISSSTAPRLRGSSMSWPKT